MDNKYFYQAAVAGGLVSAFTDAMPFLNLANCLCCLGIASGGIVALLYLKKYSGVPFFTLPEMIRLGLVTGIIGAFISFGFQYIVFQLYGNWQIEWIKNMIENMQDVPPLWENIYEQINTPEYQSFAGFSIFIRSLIIYPLFTSLGALITNQILIKKQNK